MGFGNSLDLDESVSEQFYFKKKLLAQRDKYLEDIGRAVFQSEHLPEKFADLPREFLLKDTLREQLLGRKSVLRDARHEVMHELEKLEGQTRAIDANSLEKVGPARQERDRLKLRLDFAKDQSRKVVRGQQDLVKQIEELSCRIHALDMRIRAGNQHYQDQVEEVESRVRPLRERLGRLDQNIRQTQMEEEQLQSQVHLRFRELGYSYYENRKDPVKFEATYLKLDRLIDDLADHRKTAIELEVPETPKQESNYWKWMLAALMMGILVMVLFRTQYQRSHIDLGQVAHRMSISDDDYRFYADLTQAGMESWYGEIPELTSLPGGSIFSGMTHQDLLAFTVSRAEFGEGKLRFCGLKLRKTPARFTYRLVQQGWQRQATKLGYEALRKDGYVWIILTDREYMLVDEADLPLLEIYPEKPDSFVLRLEQELTPFDKYLALLQGLDRLELTLEQKRFALVLKPSEPLADLELRRLWLSSLQQQAGANQTTVMAFTEKGLEFSGPYDPLKAPVQRGKLKPFIYQQLSWIENDPSALANGGEKAELNPSKKNQGFSFFDLASNLQLRRQGILVFRQGEPEFEQAQSMLFGLDLVDLVALPTKDEFLAVDAGTRSVLKLGFQKNLLQITSQFWFGEEEVSASLGSNFDDFIPGKLFVSPQSDFGILLEGKMPAHGRPRIVLMDLINLKPVAVEELSTSRMPSVAAWSDEGHSLFVGTMGQTGRAGFSRVYGYRREGHVLALSRIIRVEGKGGRAHVGGLLVPSNGQDLFVHNLPPREIVRYQLNANAWQPTETVQLSEPRSGEAPVGVLGATITKSRNGQYALVMESASNPGKDKDNSVFLIDLVSPQASASQRLELPGKPLSLWRMPLSDNFWISLPEEGLLFSLRIDTATEKLVAENLLKIKSMKPKYLTSSKWGDYLLVAGEFFSGFPEP